MALYYPTSTNAVQKTLDAALLAGATTAVTLNNVVGIQDKPGVFVVDRVDSNGTATPSKREYVAFTGVSGSTLTGLTRNADGGGTDQDHAVGAIVEFINDIVQQQAILDTILVEHNDDGTHSDITATTVTTTGLVDAATLKVATSTVEADNILDEDDMASDSATALATQQSIKAYVDPTVTTATSDATPNPTGDKKYNEYYLTALAAAAEFAAPSGTPVNGNKLVIRIKDDGTGRALTYNSIYRAVGVTLPTTTVASKTIYIGAIYNSADSKWDVIAVSEEV